MLLPGRHPVLSPPVSAPTPPATDARDISALYAPPHASYVSGAAVPPPQSRPPSRALAFFLSFFAAGAGQVYLGRPRRAITWLALAVFGPILSGALVPATSRAGLFLVAMVFLTIVLLARPLSAFDTLRVTPGTRRPGVLAVVVAFVVSFALIVSATVITRRFILEAFKIPSGGMMPTLLVGDHVFVDKTATRFHRGRIAVFQFPEHPEQDFLQRVIAVGGDRVEMRRGHPWINGWEVPHCSVGRGALPADSDGVRSEGNVFVEFLDDETYLTFLEANVPPIEVEGPWTVTPGEAFMIGDNRESSHDSRRWSQGVGGGVRPELVRGEPFVIWLAEAGGAVDWSRFGALLARPRPTLPRTMAALQPELDHCLATRPPRDATVPPKG